MKMLHILLGSVLLAAIGGAVWTTVAQRDTLADATRPYRPASRPHVVSPEEQAIAEFHALHPHITQQKDIGRISAPHQHRVQAVAFSPDGSRLATAGAEGDICTWSLPDLKPLLHIETHAGVLYALAWSPDSRRLVSGGQDTWIEVWDSTTGELVDRHKQACPVTGAGFFSDGTHLVSLCGEVVRFWLIGQDDELFEATPDTDSEFSQLAVTSDNLVAIADRTGGLLLLDAQGNPLDHLRRRTQHVRGSPMAADDERNWVIGLRPVADGRVLVCDSSGVWMWDRRKSGGAAMSLIVPGVGNWHAALAPDGHTLLIGMEHAGRVIDLTSGKTLVDSFVAGSELGTVDIDPQGRWYAIGSGGVYNEQGIEDRGPTAVQLFDLRAVLARGPSKDQPKPADTRDIEPWQ
jgi:WD40 repeat protein